MPFDERRIVAAGMSTAVLEYGDGEPVVLLHGPGEYALGWTETIVGLATTHRLVAPDLPGHGGSVAFAGLGDERVLAWLDDVIAATCPTAPVVIGRVLGGAIAARYAAVHGERIAQLVLVDSFGLSAFEPAPPFGEALQRFLGDPTEQSHDQLMRYCAYDFDAVRRRFGEAWTLISQYAVECLRRPATQAALMALMQQYGGEIPEAVLAAISVPTTLIWGRHDMATPLRVAEEASRAFGWPLLVVEDAADDPGLDQPDAFVRAVRVAIEQKVGAR